MELQRRRPVPFSQSLVLDLVHSNILILVTCNQQGTIVLADVLDVKNMTFGLVFIGPQHEVSILCCQLGAERAIRALRTWKILDRKKQIRRYILSYHQRMIVSHKVTYAYTKWYVRATSYRNKTPSLLSKKRW